MPNTKTSPVYDNFAPKAMNIDPFLNLTRFCVVNSFSFKKKKIQSYYFDCTKFRLHLYKIL